MSTGRHALLVPAATALVVVLAAGCGSSNSKADSASTAPASATAAPTTAATSTPGAPSTTPSKSGAATPPSTTPSKPPTTTPPSTTAAPGPATTMTPDTEPAETDKPVDGPGVEITVEVGVDDAVTTGGRVEQIPLGTDVTLRIVDNDRAQTYHVHGYNLESKVPKGVEASFEFTADKAGSFDVESHVTNKVLVTLQVS
jgi:hypothetical protein